jgi:subtilisin family serine protease
MHRCPARVVTLAALYLLSIGSLHAQNGPAAIPVIRKTDFAGQPKYRPDELLVRFRLGTSPQAKQTAHLVTRASSIRTWASIDGLELVRLPAGSSLQAAIAAYRQNPNVLYAEPNFIVHALGSPNDPDFSQQWNLQNTGQQAGSPGADIHAVEAWTQTTGSPNVVVAVIDSGIDYTHPDLASNVWSSPTGYSGTLNSVPITCAPGTHGFNAVADTCDPMDDFGHGSHVSGTIGAVGNNGVGVVGVNWTVQIMACKFLDFTGAGLTSGAITCLDFVKAMKDQGANIVATNNSWGGGGFSQALSDAIKAQQQDGILFVAAAGNDFSDNDVSPTYPAGFFLPNVVSVAATDRLDDLAYFSNVGSHSVHIAAPGQEILSTTPQDTYTLMSGTSMSAPHVTGVAALLAAFDPTLDWRAIKNRMLAGGDTIPSVANTISGKRLNAYGAMTCNNSKISKRLQPIPDVTVGTKGQDIVLAAINVNCAQPAGPVTVTISPGGQTVTLLDDGAGADLAAGDGVYSGSWAPPGNGDFFLSFSTGETAQVTVLNNYTVGETPYNYLTITGVNLNLGDDEVATIENTFPIQFGGGSFDKLYVSSNGTISFTNAFDDFLNFDLPVNVIENANPANPPPPALLQPVVTLIAPFWTDLFPIKGTNQNVFWEVQGTAPNRELVVEWRNVAAFMCRANPSANVTFEVVLSEGTNNVVFNYANTAFGGNCSSEDNGQDETIGIQVNQNQGVQWGSNQQSIAGGIALLWTPIAANPAPNPVPTLTAASPSSIAMGSGDTWVTLTGTGFVPNSEVSIISNQSTVTKYISSTQIQVLLTADMIAFPLETFVSEFQATVSNPPPGGGLSNPLTIPFIAQTPEISSLSPSTAPAGSFGFIMTINGSGFAPFPAVVFNGVIAQATFVSPTQISFGVPGEALQNAGTIPVQVKVSPNDVSNVVIFTVTPATTPAAILASPPTSSSQGPATGSPTKRPTAAVLPGRFLGWRAANQLGKDYLARFTRPRVGTATVNRAPAQVSSKEANVQTAASSSLPAGFNFRPTLPTDFLPAAIVTGDFNGDGKIDWAIANAGSNTIWIFLGNGDGTWHLPRVITVTGASPVALATGDLNHDGKLDLVVAEADSGTVGVLLGNGDGTFGPELSFATPGLPESLAVADFNNDGNLDVLVGQFGDASVGQLAFLVGDGTGKLSSPIIHYGQIEEALFTTYTLAVADLNGDGLPDVVALDYSVAPIDGSVDLQEQAANAQVYLNQGDGTFKVAQRFSFDTSNPQGAIFSGIGSIGATAIALGDVNKDGCVDAVTLDTTGTATLFPGLCDGNFDTANIKIFATGITAGVATLADVNGDGNLDLISAAFPFMDTSPFPSSDGESLSVMFGDGAGNFGTPTLFRGEAGMFGIAVADLNGDHFPEILTANQGTDTASIYFNDGHGGFGAPKGGYLGYLETGQMHAISNSPITNFGFVDANGDGHKDLVALELGTLNPLPIQVAVLPGDGAGNFGGPIRSPILDADYSVLDMALEDFRNIHRPDLLLLGITGSPGASIFYGLAKNNGDGTFQKPAIVLLPNAFATQFVVGDFNNDGNLDFLILSGSSSLTGTNAVASLVPYLGDGTGVFTQGQAVSFNLPPGVNGFTHAFVGDFNHDGKMDLLVQGSSILNSTDQNALYELLGNGDGTFRAPSLLFNNFEYFSIADLNGDGQPDIVELEGVGLTTRNSPLPGKVFQIYLGNLDGSFTKGQSYGPFPGAFGTGYLFGSADQPMHVNEPAIADFNGDGKLDIGVFQYLDGTSLNLFGTVTGPINSSVTILTGNGDGTFTNPNSSFYFGRVVVPQTYGDANGDGRTDLIEMNGFTSSYNILSATAGPSFTARLVSDPVIGTTGTLRITLATPAAAVVSMRLSASDLSISIPLNINIPQGANTQDVPFQIGSAFDSRDVFALTVTQGSESHTTYGTQAQGRANNGFSVGFSVGLRFDVTPVIAPSQATPDYGLIVASNGGYSTQIQVSCQGLPAGATCQIGTNPIPLPAGQVFVGSLAVATTSAVSVGIYKFSIVLTDGVLTSTIPAAFDVGDFGLSLTPTSNTLGMNDFTAFTLGVQSIDGYAQPIQFTCSGLPSGTICPFFTTILATSASNYFQLHTQNAAPGTYTFTITGTSGPLVHSVSATLIVSPGSFSGSASPPFATINVGGSQNFNVEVDSLNGFQGQVTLSCALISGISCQFAPGQVSVNTNQAGASVLTISVSATPESAQPMRTPKPSVLQFSWAYLSAVVTFGWIMLILSYRHAINIGRWQLHSRGLFLFALLVLSISTLIACGGGGTSFTSGGGGGGGGGVPARVIVQGTAGGTTVNICTIPVTVP